MSAGRRIYIISVEACDVKIKSNRFGNITIVKDAKTHITPVIIKADDTVEPMDFLSFFPEKYETFLDNTTGIPLETKVINTAKILIAT